MVRPSQTDYFPATMSSSEVGIYKGKQESKKTRKQELDQESDQEKKKVFSFSSYFLL